MEESNVPTGAPEAIRELPAAVADDKVFDAGNAPSDDAPATDDSGDETVQPELSDEDYRLNFLGSDKFELPRETPEEVRAALKALEKSLNKGWTEKNQSIAEQRRAFMEQQQQWQMEQAAAREIENDRLELKALQKQLEAYDKLAPTDWQAWSQSDPTAAQQGFMTYQALKSQVERQQQAISAKQSQAMQTQQQRAEAWLAHADQKLSTEIPDWGADKKRAIAEFVTKEYFNTGNPMDQGAFQAFVWHPGFIRMANEAMAYRNSVTRAKTPPKAPAPQPVAKAAGGTAPAGKDPERMTDAEWIAQRNKSIEMSNLRRLRR